MSLIHFKQRNTKKVETGVRKCGGEGVDGSNFPQTPLYSTDDFKEFGCFCGLGRG